MTRPSKREIERDVEQLRKDAAGGPQRRPVFEVVYVDPSTNRLYDGVGAEPEPISGVPEADEVVLSRRTFVVALDDAEEYDQDVVDVDRESAHQPLAILRSELADSVDKKEAITVDDLPDRQLSGDVIDFHGGGG